ncbi:hypothetical protein D3C75_827860 [compost metagenome]
MEAGNGDQVGQAQRAQLRPVDIGQATRIAQRQGLDEPCRGVCDLRGDGRTGALAPSGQAVRGTQLPRGAGITHVATRCQPVQQRMPFAIEAPWIDTRAWRPHAQRQLPVRAGVQAMSLISPGVDRPAPGRVPEHLQPLSTQHRRRIGRIDPEFEPGVSRRLLRQVDDLPPDQHILGSSTGRQLRLQCPMPMAGRPGQAEQQRSRRAPAPAQHPAQRRHGGRQNRQPQRRQHRQHDTGQGAGDQSGCARGAQQRRQGPISSHRHSVPW